MQAHRRAVARAARALGLHHGPIHAECRVSTGRVFVLEVARAADRRVVLARAAVPATGTAADADASLESVLLRHASATIDRWRARRAAAARDDDPDSRARIAARRRRGRGGAPVPGVEDVRSPRNAISCSSRCPKRAAIWGSSLRGARPRRAEEALRDAHAR